MIEADKEYSLAQIIQEVGFPFVVRKSTWSANFEFRAESIEIETVKGTAFKDGAVHTRLFGGGYSYNLHDHFIFCRSLQSVPAEVELHTETKSSNPPQLNKMKGSIIKKAFKKREISFDDPNALILEESDNLQNIQASIKKIIVSLRKRFVKPEAPDWTDLETGPYGIATNPSMVEYYETKMGNARIQDDIDTMESVYDNPYFSHAQVQLNNESSPRDLFIGRELVYDSDNTLPVVINWQSELGNIAYDTKHTSFDLKNGRANLLYKRKVEIRSGQVQDVIEEYNHTKGKKKSSSKEEEQMVYDSFLMKVLREKHNQHEVRDIIPSIQYNQNQIIRAPHDENFIVQGCAGCGKTMILLHRISYLLFNYKSILPSKYLVLSPSENFNQSLRTLIKDLKIQNIPLRSTSEYYIDYLLNLRTAYRKDDGTLTFFNPWHKNNFNREDFNDSEVDLDYLNYLYSEEYANELFERSSARKERLSQTLLDISKEKDQTLRERLERKCRVTPFDDEFVDLLPEKYQRRALPNCKAELYVSALLTYYCYESKTDASFIFIDEAQDLTKQELIFIKTINPNGRINAYGDLEQGIYNYSIKNWSDFEPIGNFNFYTLNENYRNTREITDFINDELFQNMTALGLDGQKPQNIPEASISGIIRASNTEDRIVTIIATNREINSVNLPENIPVYHVFDIKGMEFDTVFVFPEGMSENELYISYSRAIDKLYIIKE